MHITHYFVNVCKTVCVWHIDLNVVVDTCLYVSVLPLYINIWQHTLILNKWSVMNNKGAVNITHNRSYNLEWRIFFIFVIILLKIYDFWKYFFIKTFTYISHHIYVLSMRHEMLRHIKKTIWVEMSFNRIYFKFFKTFNIYTFLQIFIILK